MAQVAPVVPVQAPVQAPPQVRYPALVAPVACVAPTDFVAPVIARVAPMDFVAPIIAINSTTQDFSWLVLLILHYVREVLGNSQVIPDLKQDGKKPVPNAGTELGQERLKGVRSRYGAAIGAAACGSRDLH